LSFVESAPRAYRLKVGNADLFRNSTEPGTSPMTVAELVALLLTKPQDLPVAYSLCSEQCLLSVDMRCIVGLVGDGEPYVALCAGGRERVVRHSLWFR
ncbi:hypothetical protein, partial [Bradyrhizobium sp. th.b2]|uniref:hypothetical protein n=1 Tax=Bradyrhizobium sp. th-b2 TaxID=172088 RepID=UPI001AEC37B6